MTKAPRCRTCGCYDYVHSPDYNPWAAGSQAHDEFRPPAHRFSRATRLELWFMDHDTIWVHAKAWAWLHLQSSRSRWAYIHRLYERHPEVCWCSLVDSWWYAEPSMRGDYRKPNGCVCDFPLPSRSMVPPPDSGCYCTPQRLIREVAS